MVWPAPAVRADRFRLQPPAARGARPGRLRRHDDQRPTPRGPRVDGPRSRLLDRETRLRTTKLLGGPVLDADPTGPSAMGSSRRCFDRGPLFGGTPAPEGAPRPCVVEIEPSTRPEEL